MLDLGISESLSRIIGTKPKANTGGKSVYNTVFGYEAGDNAHTLKGEMNNNVTIGNGGHIVPTNSGQANFNKENYPQNTPQPTQKTSPEIVKMGGGSSDDAKRKQALQDNIVAGWDDFGNTIKRSANLWDKSKKYVDSLGSIRDRYNTLSDERLAKTNTAVAGNKELIDKNQRKQLDLLAQQGRQKTLANNNLLGLYGASGGSASKMMDRAMQKDLGQNRANYLTQFGDQRSAQDQELSKANERRNADKTWIDNWLKDNTEQAMREYADAVSAINDLKARTGKLESQDKKAESKDNLNRALARLDQLNSMAYAWQNGIETKAKEMGMNADALANENVNITAPAELATPDYNPDVTFQNGQQTQDYYDPNKTNAAKKVIGYDAMGNPIYEDAVATA